MARYLDEASAAADGYTNEHQPERSRFVLKQGDRVWGEAHYTLFGDGADGGVDFDHTVVDPELRGTGLAALLAHRAVTDEVSHGRAVRASCWFIEGYLAKHPELLEHRG
jgi:predicted GNAT family acetyltransferase